MVPPTRTKYHRFPELNITYPLSFFLLSMKMNNFFPPFILVEKQFPFFYLFFDEQEFYSQDKNRTTNRIQEPHP